MTDTPRPMRTQRHTVPSHIEAAVARALEKLPADRFASAAEFSAALADTSFRAAQETPARAPVTRRTSARGTYALIGVTVALAVLAAWGWLRTPPASRVMRYGIALPQSIVDANLSGNDAPTISPDGRHIVYTGADGRLLRRDEDDLDAAPLIGTENAWTPAFSLDGKSVAFVVGFPGDLRVAPLTGGSPVTLVHDSAWAAGISWSEDGWLYYPGRRGVALMRVRASGGSPELVTRADTTKDELFLYWPSAVDGGRALVFTIWRRRGTPDIAAMDLKTKQVRVLTNGVRALPTPTGHLLVLQGNGALVAFGFDAKRLSIDGQPRVMVDGLRVPEAGRAFLAVSANGTLLYERFRPTQHLIRVARDGTPEPTEASWGGNFDNIALSPDGSRIVVAVTNQGRQEIWVKTLDGGPFTRIAATGSRNARPGWLPDGRSVSFIADFNAQYEIFRATADGGGGMQRVLAFERSVDEATWSRDGKWLVFRAGSGSGRHLYYVQLGVDSTPRPVARTDFEEYSPTLSPDGRWLAFGSNASGRDEVYVVAFPGTPGGATMQVSPAGGSEPLWANSGRELFYRDAKGDLVAVAVTAEGDRLRVASRRSLFSAKEYLTDNRSRDFAVAPDDRFFYFLRADAPSPTSMVIVLNWFEELKAKMR